MGGEGFACIGGEAVVGAERLLVGGEKGLDCRYPLGEEGEDCPLPCVLGACWGSLGPVGIEAGKKRCALRDQVEW